MHKPIFRITASNIGAAVRVVSRRYKLIQERDAELLSDSDTTTESIVPVMTERDQGNERHN